MARVVRADVFNPREVSVFHCINRCVRRCFLCGVDCLTGRDYEYRKSWLQERLAFLAGCFGIDVLGFAILANHFHAILRNRPDVVDGWSDVEVARRWYRLCPLRKATDGLPEEPTEAELTLLLSDARRLAAIRLRLSDISWFMRFTAEHVARRANAEEGAPGRFWQGRFKSVKLCDEAAILACGVYVDLNVIRAGCAETPETSEHTSAKLRIEGRAEWLAPLSLDERESPCAAASRLETRASDKGFLPLSLAEYIELLDWTGRQFAPGKRGAIPANLPPILQRVGIPHETWLEVSLGFGKLFHRVAGCTASLAREACSHPRRTFRAPGAGLLAASRVRMR